MSAISSEAFRKGYLLYRHILKAHAKNLPTQMRALGMIYSSLNILGDIYVREEFRQNFDNADGDQFDKFLTGYC